MLQPSRLAAVKTKIVATLGPVSEAPEMLEQLIRAGVDVFRLNFAHGDWAWHDAVLARIRQTSERLGKQVAVLQDLAGPKLRLGDIPGGSLQCELGHRVRIVRAPSGGPGDLTISHPEIVDELLDGAHVLIADGSVGLRIVAHRPGVAEAEVTLPGEVRSRQGFNVVGAQLGMDALTDKDRRDLDWTAQHEVDFVGMSFVRRPEDVLLLRDELKRRGSPAQIIAKIEKAEALDQLDAIIQKVDGIMVARGDLGVEIDVARVPMLQKHIIQRCNHFGVPVITATQMLESMRTSNRPTRAEASDVANAILDGTDAVMLSAETATGQYPLAAVATMNRIAQETERTLRRLTPTPLAEPAGMLVHSAITLAMVQAAGTVADRLDARLVVAATHEGHTALALSKERNFTPTLGLSHRLPTVRRMALYWGVIPAVFAEDLEPQQFVEPVAAWVRDQGMVASGDRLVFVFGTRWADGSYNALLVHEVK